MRKTLVWCGLALSILAVSTTFVIAQGKRQPVSDREVLALVAGNSLSEDIADEIAARGISFRPSEQFRALVIQAGGDTRVTTAIERAKTVQAGSDGAPPSSEQLLQHLSNAGKQIRLKNYEEAAQELSAALQSGAGPEAGFVMGETLQRQEDWTGAANMYAEVLHRDSSFTAAQIKLSYVLYHLGDGEAALREARAALTRLPASPEAHRYAGIAFDTLRKRDAAEKEYREAIRLKPDYAATYYNLGIFFGDAKDWDQSIAAYKKSIALDPNDERAHYNLANTFGEKGDPDSAIREYREAIRVNPQMLWARNNLGSALMDRNMFAEAAAVFRELEAMAPDFGTCHACFGSALFQIGDIPGAEKEFTLATSLNPTDELPHLGFGEVHEQQKDYDAALAEYHQAEQLNNESSDAFRDAGRVQILRKDFVGAAKELRTAEELKPSDVEVHSLYGRALLETKDVSKAVEEFKQAASLNPSDAQLKLDLAGAFERNADWVGAIDQYRQAAQTDAGAEVQNQFQAAQARLNRHLELLKSSGKAKEAADLEAQIRAAKSDPGISQRLDAAMQRGWDAASASRADEAEAQYTQAVALAEQLHPGDERLAASLIHLAWIFDAKHDWPRTEATLQRALAANVKLYGASSPTTTEPLQALGTYELSRRNYDAALEYFSRAEDVNEKTFGESSDKVADSLRFVAHVYVEQKAYDKAEPYLLRAVHINEALFGENQSGLNSVPLWELCELYDSWNKPDKAAQRYGQMLNLLEKQNGADSPVLLTTLTGEAGALRRLGRAAEATKLEQRAKSIRSAMGDADNVALSPQ